MNRTALLDYLQQFDNHTEAEVGHADTAVVLVRQRYKIPPSYFQPQTFQHISLLCNFKSFRFYLNQVCC